MEPGRNSSGSPAIWTAACCSVRVRLETAVLPVAMPAVWLKDWRMVMLRLIRTLKAGMKSLRRESSVKGRGSAGEASMTAAMTPPERVFVELSQLATRSSDQLPKDW